MNLPAEPSAYLPCRRATDQHRARSPHTATASARGGGRLFTVWRAAAAKEPVARPQSPRPSVVAFTTPMKPHPNLSRDVVTPSSPPPICSRS